MDGIDTVVGLGSNLGDRRTTLSGAIREVRQIRQIAEVAAISPLYETEAVGAPGPPYLNAAIRVVWKGSPRALLLALLGIEATFGRVRRERFGPRTLDLDILWMADTIVAEENLVIPHARLIERRFALEPLLDVAPTARHPATGEPLAASLGSLRADGVRRVAEGDWSTSARSTI